jgi:hypothetical protein|tara:strand:+ start:282 stop:455 length:174 start_codon:yes stop_codon:yes gene_type:complete
VERHKMSNLQQYLMQMADEFRKSYEDIANSQKEIMDKQDVLAVRMQELETRLNKNLE